MGTELTMAIVMGMVMGMDKTIVEKGSDRGNAGVY